MSTSLVTAQANGTSSGVLIGAQDDKLVQRVLQISGTFNSATVTVELSCDGTNFAAKDKDGADHMSATEEAYGVVETMGKAWVRIVVAGGGGSESINLLSN